MAHIQLNNVSIDFPIYNANARSLKNQLIRLTTGGKLLADAKKHIIVKALDNINLNISHQDRIGLIGHNGAGKSTFLKLLAGIYEPTDGSISVQGKISSLLDIMQGVEAESTGYENIFMRGILLGLSKKQIQAKIEEIAQFTELGDYLHMPLRTYSSGMTIRLAFGIATCIEPEILLIDEVFGVGDAAFVDKAKQKMLDLLNKSSIVIFASHDAHLMQQFCNKGLVLDGGQLKYFGEIGVALEQYDKLRKHY